MPDKREVVRMLLVTLVNLETFQEQEIGIRSPDPHLLPCVEDLQKWVDTNDFNPPLLIKNPVVVRVRVCRAHLGPVKV